MKVDDDLVTPLPRHIGPNPLQKNAPAKARRRQEPEVYRRPGEPRPEPTHLDLAALQHRKTLAHYRHGAFVKIAKWTRAGIGPIPVRLGSASSMFVRQGIPISCAVSPQSKVAAD